MPKGLKPVDFAALVAAMVERGYLELTESQVLDEVHEGKATDVEGLTMATDKYAKFSKPWRWSSEPRPLVRSGEAPEQYGFYEIGYLKGGTFDPRYGGRAAGTTLRRRLRKHFEYSHNPHIRHEAGKGKLWFRYKVFDTPAEARFVEALQVIAFQEEYEWNDRQEWAEHWALER